MHSRFGALVAAALVAAACGSSTPAGPVSAINATLADFKMDLGGAIAKAGDVTFSVENKGANKHEFVIVQADTKADALPVGTDDLVDESAFTPVDELEDIEPGAKGTLTVNLKAGHYVILCNIESHYGKGMHTDLQVQ